MFAISQKINYPTLEKTGFPIPNPPAGGLRRSRHVSSFRWKISVKK